LRIKKQETRLTLHEHYDDDYDDDDDDDDDSGDLNVNFGACCMTLCDIYLEGLRRAGSRVEIRISDPRNM